MENRPRRREVGGCFGKNQTAQKRARRHLGRPRPLAGRYHARGIRRQRHHRLKLHIPSAVVAADSELDWFKDDFNEVSFTGNPVLVAGYESSYSVKVFDK